MNVQTLKVEQIGQIEHAEVQFGDLTVLVGPQATGKSIFLQFLKLLVDTGAVFEQLNLHGLDWEKSLDNFLDTFLGEGMKAIWRGSKSTISVDHKSVNLPELVRRQKPRKDVTLFFIPAQRVLTLARGMATPFHGLQSRRSVHRAGFQRKGSLAHGEGAGTW
jgi:hypothetical protein